MDRITLESQRKAAPRVSKKPGDRPFMSYFSSNIYVQWKDKSWHLQLS